MILLVLSSVLQILALRLICLLHLLLLHPSFPDVDSVDAHVFLLLGCSLFKHELCHCAAALQGLGQLFLHQLFPHAIFHLLYQILLFQSVLGKVNV